MLRNEKRQLSFFSAIIQQCCRAVFRQDIFFSVLGWYFIKLVHLLHFCKQNRLQSKPFLLIKTKMPAEREKEREGKSYCIVVKETREQELSANRLLLVGALMKQTKLLSLNFCELQHRFL